MKHLLETPSASRPSAFILPVVGVGCLLFVCIARGADPVAPAEPPSPGRLSSILRHWLLWSTVLLVAATAGLVALLRFSRRLRQQIELWGKPRKTTDTSDAWQQYRLPPDWDEEPRIDDDPIGLD